MILKAIKTGLLFFAIVTCFSAEAAEFDTLRVLTSAQCDMCKDRLEKALNFEKGVRNADLNIDDKILTVVYNPEKTNPEKIRKAVTMAGYDADGLPADPKAYKKLDDCCKKE